MTTADNVAVASELITAPLWSFHFDATAFVCLGLSLATILLGARRAFGRRRSAIVAVVLLVISNAALAAANNPWTLLAVGQAQLFLTWGLALFLGSDNVRPAIGRWLIASCLVDAVLLAAAATSPVDAHHVFGVDAVGWPLAWGLTLSFAVRLGLLPVGIIPRWKDAHFEEFAGWFLVALFPAASVPLLKLIEVLAVEPAPRMAVTQFLVATSVLAAIGASRQDTDTEETAWRTAAILGAFAAVSATIPARVGKGLWSIGVLLVLLTLAAVPNAVPRRLFHRHRATEAIERFRFAVAEEWNIPRLWRFLVELPLIGGSHVLRFVDGFAFEQLPRQLAARVQRVAHPIAHAVPELFGRLLVPVLLAGSMLILLGLAFR